MKTIYQNGAELSMKQLAGSTIGFAYFPEGASLKELMLHEAGSDDEKELMRIINEYKQEKQTMGVLPQVGDKRRLKFADGSRLTITVAQVQPSECGEKAYEVWDTQHRKWVFAVPPRIAPITTGCPECPDELKVRL